jgi:hypothetical protein
MCINGIDDSIRCSKDKNKEITKKLRTLSI